MDENKTTQTHQEETNPPGDSLMQELANQMVDSVLEEDGIVRFSDRTSEDILEGSDTPEDISTFRDFSDIMRERVFLGNVPFNAILEGIKDQFENYLTTEDTFNYVDIYYHQRMISINEAPIPDGDGHKQELMEILDSIHMEFISTIQELFKLRLVIGIPELDANEFSIDSEFLIRRLYEFFILSARENFRAVIALKVCEEVGALSHQNNTIHLQGEDVTDVQKNETIDAGSPEFISNIVEELTKYHGIITCITPDVFLKIRGDETIRALYEEGYFNGNFLTKYSPKLYQNEDLKIEIINRIMLIAEKHSAIATLNNIEEDSNSGGI